MTFFESLIFIPFFHDLYLISASRCFYDFSYLVVFTFVEFLLKRRFYRKIMKVPCTSTKDVPQICGGTFIDMTSQVIEYVFCQDQLGGWRF